MLKTGAGQEHMRKRNFIHTRGELLEKGREIISSSAENKYIFRAVPVFST